MIIDFNKNSNKMREWNGQRIYFEHTHTVTFTLKYSRVHTQRSLANDHFFFVFFCSVSSESYCIYRNNTEKNVEEKKHDTFKSSLK